MFDYVKKQISDFDGNSFLHALRLLVIMALIMMMYGFIFSGFQIVDEFEHLHASWLVGQQKVPYRDFFEHHHPLLWYISYPIVEAFYDNVIIFYIMRGISFSASLLTLFYVYKIALFFTNKVGAWLCVSISLCNLIMAYNFYQFRPDNFMNLFFFIAVYYWFCYLENKKILTLIISFLCFGISFLFLQKIALLLIFVEIILLWLIVDRKMSLKKTITASIPTILLISCFIGYFIIIGAGIDFFALNFRFNQALVYYFERGAFWYKNLFLSFYAIAIITGLYLFKKRNINFKIIMILCVAEFLMRAFYFSPHPNYYTTLVYLSALVFSAIFTNENYDKNKTFCILFIFVLFANLGIVFNKIIISSEKYNSLENYNLSKYVHENSGKNDTIMNGYNKNFNIYRNDASYYWFGLDMLIPVIEQEFGVKNLVNVNSIILTQRPKFIYTQNHIDLRALRLYGETKYSQVFELALIDNFYQKTPFEYLAVLK